MRIFEADEATSDVAVIFFKYILVIVLIYLVLSFLGEALAYISEKYKPTARREAKLAQSDEITILDAVALTYEGRKLIKLTEDTESIILDTALIFTQSEQTLTLTDSTEDAITDSVSLTTTPELIHTEEWSLPPEPSFSLLHTEEWTT